MLAASARGWFGLTNDRRRTILLGMSRRDVTDVIRAYPQVYLACHIDHRTRGRSAAGITSREAAFLTHIEADGASLGPLLLRRPRADADGGEGRRLP